MTAISREVGAVWRALRSTRAYHVVRRMLRRLRPFNGFFAYEIQVGPWVIQRPHLSALAFREMHGASPLPLSRIGRLYVWRDDLWLT